MRNARPHPTEYELEEMDNQSLKKYAKEEAQLLLDQKQTAVPRLLLELVARL